MEEPTAIIMPVINHVGISDHTIKKQAALEKILDVHTQIVKRIIYRPSSSWADKSYLFCDLNAGPGKYGEILGSPLIFSKVAQHNKINYIGVFSEINKKNSQNLMTNICSMDQGSAWDHAKDMLRHSNVTGCTISNGGVEIVCHENNTITLESIKDMYSRKGFNSPFGFIYVDPNNHEGKFAELKELFNHKTFKYLDILIHISGTTIKRISKSHQTQRLLEMLKPINKKHWLIQKPDTAFHWTFLLGTNWPGYPEDKRLDLVFVNSTLGQMYMNQVNYTVEELKNITNNDIL